MIAAAASFSAIGHSASLPAFAAGEPKPSPEAAKLLPVVIQLDQRVTTALQALEGSVLHTLFHDIEAALHPLFQSQLTEARSCYVALHFLAGFLSPAIQKWDRDPSYEPSADGEQVLNYELYALAVGKCATEAGHAPVLLNLQSHHVKAL